MISLNVPRISLLTVSALLLGTSVAVANPGFGEDVFTVRAGGYFSDFDTNVRLSGPNGGDRVNLENALGLDSNQTVFRGDMSWRFAPRHRVVVEYVDFRREATGSAKRSFVIDTEDGTYEFDAGATLKTNFDWQLIPVTYTYSFYKSKNLEVAGSAGIHWFQSKIGYKGEATVTPPGSDEGQEVASAAESESASGPLPVFGVQAGYALSKHWFVGAKVGWFGLDYDDYSGELWDLGVTTEYWFSENFGAGVGYGYYSIDISVDNGAFETAADYTYNGLNVYVAFRY